MINHAYLDQSKCLYHCLKLFDWLVKQRLSKHQTVEKWLDRKYTKFKFIKKQVPQYSVSVREKRQKRGSELLGSVKAGPMNENLQLSDLIIGKQTCFLLVALKNCRVFCE